MAAASLTSTATSRRSWTTSTRRRAFTSTTATRCTRRRQADFDKWLADNGYPKSSHAGIPDTSEMLYLGGDAWVRKDLIKTALGDPVRAPGRPRDPNAPRVNNGI